ncbi:MAG TPA: hypothetical protein VMW28_00585 [Pelolinea sp.]|nr:hypothetical protein [Pelolinea sp.]
MRRFPSFLIILFIILSACQPVNNSSREIFQISRLESIPEGKQKILPEDDPTPPILHSDEWETLVPLECPVTTAGLEDSPFITPDGNILFFFFTPSADIPAQEQVNDGVTGIYWTHKVNDEWQEPERVWLTKPGKISLDGCPFYSGNTLWFCSIREGNFKDIDFWKADWDGRQWTNFSNAGKKLNKEIQVGELHLTSNGRTIYFHQMGLNGQSGLDIWSTSLVNGEWEDPIFIEILNTAENDSHLGLSPDDLELWFTRTYLGTPAVYTGPN